MAAVDPAYGQWLKADAIYLRATPGGAAAWGDRGVTSKGVSALALRQDAVDEANRQISFLRGPLARDRVTVAGARRNLLGRTVRVFGDRLGYEAGAIGLIIGIDEGASETVLTVIRSIA